MKSISQPIGKQLGLPSPRYTEVAVISATVAVLWIVSSWCYYALVDALSLDSGYNDAPIVFAIFYIVWSGIALILFRSVLAVHTTPRRLVGHVIALAPIMLIYAFYVTVLLPLLPDVSVKRAPANPPEFMFASAWYYLPKSIDILFQQILVAAMILGAHRARISLRMMSVGLALLFGGLHLLLIFDGMTLLYVTRFTIAATIFGLLLPYLYLRTRNGFRWAYGMHWSFYAVDAAVTHLLLAVPPWMM
tara:strand:- start:4211 stop:4951 length:741 start_codon:yes stop_codon:yes gene_type:complete